jgi:hypothetical protein
VKEIRQNICKKCPNRVGEKILEFRFWEGSCTQAAIRVTHIAVFGGFFGSPPTTTHDKLHKETEWWCFLLKIPETLKSVKGILGFVLLSKPLRIPMGMGGGGGGEIADKIGYSEFSSFSR